MPQSKAGIPVGQVSCGLFLYCPNLPVRKQHKKRHSPNDGFKLRMQYIYTMHPLPLKQPFTCIVVDDDEIDRLTVLAFLSEYPQATVLDSFEAPAKALEVINHAKPD